MTDSSARLHRLLRYVELDPGNRALRLEAIRAAFTLGDWATARSLLDAGLVTHAADAQLLELSGFSHLQAQDYRDAEQALREALDAGASSPELEYHLAIALFMQRRYADALANLGAWVAEPQNARARVLRARCLHHLGRLDEATAELQTHLDISPGDPEADGLMALLLYEQGSIDRAQSHADAALGRAPQQIEALLARASMQFDARALDAARSSYDAVVGVDPRCGRAWLGLALLNLRELKLDAAKRDIQRATVHLPEHLGTWHVLAWIHIMLGDVAGAQAAFERALALDRNFGETHGGLAVIAALQNREEVARSNARRALRLDPRSLSAKYAEMLLLKHHGRHDDARAVLDSVLSREAGRGGVRYRELLVEQLQSLQASGNPSATVYH
jgi:tetratricopeptide (TPR) repeat protein